MKRLLQAVTFSRTPKTINTLDAANEEAIPAAGPPEEGDVEAHCSAPDTAAATSHDHAESLKDNRMHALAWPPPLSEGSAMRPSSRGISRGSQRPASRDAVEPSRPDLASRGSSRGSVRSGWSRGGPQGEAKASANLLTPRNSGLGKIAEDMERTQLRSSSRPRGTASGSRPVTNEGARRQIFSRGSQDSSGTGTGQGDLRRRWTGGGHEPPDDGNEVKGGTPLKRTSERKICCGLVSWPDTKNLPDLPALNVFGMPLSSPLRAWAIRLAIRSGVERFWMLLGLIHFLIGLPEVQDNVFGCTGAIPPSTAALPGLCTEFSVLLLAF